MSVSPLSIRRGVFVTDNKAHLPLMCHYGSAFRDWCRTDRPPPLVRRWVADYEASLRPRDVTWQDVVFAQLDIIKMNGYDGIRWWDNLGWYDGYWDPPVAFTGFVAQSGQRIPQTRGYYGKLRRFIRVCTQLGLALHHSRGDCNGIPLEKTINHSRRVHRIYRQEGVWPWLYEGNNEDWQNGDYQPEGLRRIVEPFAGDCLTALSHKSEERVDLNAYKTRGLYYVHGHRGQQATDRHRHVFSLGYDKPAERLGWQGEPIGPGSSVNSTTDYEELGCLAAMAWLSRQAWTYMSGAGVRWDEPIDEQPGFKAVIDIREQIDRRIPNLMGFDRLTHRGRPDAILTAGDDRGRIDQAINARNGRVVAVCHGDCHRVRNSSDRILRVTRLRPSDTGAKKQEWVLQPGEEHDVTYRAGAVLIGIPV